MAHIGFIDFSDGYACLDASKDPLVEITALVPVEEIPINAGAGLAQGGSEEKVAHRAQADRRGVNTGSKSPEMLGQNSPTRGFGDQPCMFLAPLFLGAGSGGVMVAGGRLCSGIRSA